MDKLTIECDIGKVSDGYHTFDELYELRNLLFIALMKAYPDKSWRAYNHYDRTIHKRWFIAGHEGWFIAGINLDGKNITCYLPMEMWELLNDSGVKTLRDAPKWDGHTPKDVISRLRKWLSKGF